MSVVILRGDAGCLPMADESVDAVVCDPPYGLEFMGREWDTFRTGDGFRRSRNEADAGRNSVFGRASRTSPEYSTGEARIGKPGLGDRPTAWVSNQGWNAFRCRTCGHLAHGGSPCACERPDFARADDRWNAFQEWCEAWAAECLRVLKPGGHLAAFGGTRTYHRLTCAIEDAGFEIRDSLHWIYGSGFPKSASTSRAIDRVMAPGEIDPPESEAGKTWEGWGTALKPSHEPVVLARKPLARTVAANVLEHGTGALNIAACRVGTDVRVNNAGGVSSLQRVSRVEQGYRPTVTASQNEDSVVDGRWPPNVLLGEEAAAELDRQSGSTVSRRGGLSTKALGVMNDDSSQARDVPRTGHDDSGGASRFFPVFRYEAKAGASERPRLPDGTAWPTVKPVALMQWLVRLVTPPGGTVLDLFCGTGTTGQACAIEGFNAVLLDRDPQAIALARVRLAKPIQPSLFGEAS